MQAVLVNTWGMVSGADVQAYIHVDIEYSVTAEVPLTRVTAHMIGRGARDDEWRSVEWNVTNDMNGLDVTEFEWDLDDGTIVQVRSDFLG